MADLDEILKDERGLLEVASQFPELNGMLSQIFDYFDPDAKYNTGEVARGLYNLDYTIPSGRRIMTEHVTRWIEGGHLEATREGTKYRVTGMAVARMIGESVRLSQSPTRLISFYDTTQPRGQAKYQ